jgi:hypothetical protein
VLFELRDWYISRCEELGQSSLSKIPCVYNSFGNGSRISDAHRFLYRRREDLMRAFPDPFDASDPGHSYFHWYEKHGAQPEQRHLVKLIRKHAPEPALRLAKKARTAWRSWAS